MIKKLTLLEADAIDAMTQAREVEAALVIRAKDKDYLAYALIPALCWTRLCALCAIVW